MRIGVFVCHCGTNIAATVDVEKVSAQAAGLAGVKFCATYKYMCSDPGQNLIKGAIKEHKLDRIVIASCSPHLHEKTFRRCVENAGINPYLVEMANIREHCSWVHKDREKATEKAIDLVKLAVAKLSRNKSLEKTYIPIEKKVLIIGGGISGIQAALDIGFANYPVVIVERESTIGGRMAQFDKTFPTLDCAACILTPKMVTVAQDENIQIYTYSEVEEVAGHVGNFTVKIRKRARSVDITKCTGCGVCWDYCPIRNKPHFEKIERPLSQLKQDEQETIETIINRYQGKKEGLLAILQDIQFQYNYLPRHLLEYISIKLSFPLTQIYAVANFYKAFSLKPRGKHMVSVCLGTACYVRRAPRILETIEEHLGIKAGQTRNDFKFTLETVNCLGACALGPLVVIDGEYYGHMTTAKVRKILKRYEED